MDHSGAAALENNHDARDHDARGRVWHVCELHIHERRRSMDRTRALEGCYPCKVGLNSYAASGQTRRPRDRRACSRSCSLRAPDLEKVLEAPPGFEPGMEVLQTSALPLGDGAAQKGVWRSDEHRIVPDAWGAIKNPRSGDDLGNDAGGTS